MTDTPEKPAQSSNEPTLDADEILAGLLRWVEIESPSHDGEAVNRVVEQVEKEQAALGAKIEQVREAIGWEDPRA